jgi:fructose-1,6-bisphosphatase II
MADLQRGIAMEFIRVTEAAALRSSRWLGNGDKEQVDQAASDAMRGMLDLIAIKGTVTIGEGEKDRAPMLYIGEKVGNWDDDAPEVDIAVDPVDGTRLVANGGPQLKGKLDINVGVRENLKVAAAVLNKTIKDLTIMILDRERHLSLIEEVRSAGARIKLIADGDVAGAIATAINNVDIYMGIGGAPEGVLAAAALRCLDGEIQTKFFATNEAEKEKLAKAGYNLDKIYYTEDLAKGEEIIFSATGITGGEFLEGVSFGSNQTAVTHSVVMRAKYRTIRYVKAIHNLNYKTIPSRARNAEEKV